MSKKYNINIKSRQDLLLMRESGKILAELLEVLMSKIAPGVSGDELEEVAQQYIIHKKVDSSFKGYCVGRHIKPFPAIICFSVNDEIVHGFPFGKILKDGDVVSIDCGVRYQGFHSDSAVTVKVGKVTNDIVDDLLRTTQQSLYQGIRQVKNGCKVGDIGQAVQQLVESRGFSVVRDLVGHGVGRSIHEPPEVPNYGKSGSGVKLTSGMVIAIEPMVNVGGYEISVDKDDWTIRTRDGSLSAHFEHTVAVTDSGYEVLTLRSEEKLV